jgi:RNA-directed DNA polymerase
VRYIDDFVVCFQYREDALRLEDALRNRLERFGLTLEPTKTKLVEFGRFAQRHAGQPRQKAPGNHLLLELHALLHAQPEGQLQVGVRTEKSRLRRSLMSLQEKMRQMRHLTIRQRVDELKDALRGHYGYYGIAGNFRALQKVYRHVERYWCGMLRSRSWAARRLTWTDFNQLKEKIPLLRPKLRLPYKALQALAVL